MRRNNKVFLMWGELALGANLTVILVGLIAAQGFVSTAKSGVLKRNGKVIWCQMQNKGHDYCHEKYPMPN